MTESNNDKDAEKVTDDSAEKKEQRDESLFPVEEFEEVVSVNGKKEVRRGVYLLPNLFTTGALFAGFYAVVNGIHQNFEAASIAICFAMLFDILDGRVARMTNAQSSFGAEYDSMSDMVSFGVAPALVVYTWALHYMGKLGLALAFVYVAGAAVRLARFNTQSATADKRFFLGLASPGAATILATMVWIANDIGWVGNELPSIVVVVSGVITGALGLLMVSNIRYVSFKGLDPKARVPFAAVIGMIAFFGLAVIDPAIVIFCVVGGYALSGPLNYLKFKKR